MAPSKTGMTKRGSTALRTWVISYSRHRAEMSEEFDASTRAATKRGSCRTRDARARSKSATTNREKNDRRAAIAAAAEPTPPAPTTRTRIADAPFGQNGLAITETAPQEPPRDRKACQERSTLR